MKNFLHPPLRLTPKQLERMYLEQVHKILSAPPSPGASNYAKVGNVRIEYYEQDGYCFPRRIDGADYLNRLDEK